MLPTPLLRSSKPQQDKPKGWKRDCPSIITCKTSHLMMIATIASGAAGVVTVNEIALMSVSEQWLPIESATSDCSSKGSPACERNQ
ncbi:hypothetical protein RGCCGE502_17020 [Rhizobium grahamii CCGE 502]|uniref:Uncharacterized protein n=1 Tax=Rhizobium grahamii CCGE 502 TaxID=990285 RepID=S3HV85_9HYPH|nr:hypothetical protein RGCCGE502_17020 [Rhizobium grahamii CCGE 502]